VYGYFRVWSQDWTWEFIHDVLRDCVRKTEGRQVAPTAAIVDSQSVKTPDQAGERGYDASKWALRRRVDFLLRHRPSPLPCPIRQVHWADGGYIGALVNWVKQLRPFGKLRLEIVRHCDDVKGFKVLPRRWVVGRTFGWLFKSRRLCRDYEVGLDHSAAMIRIRMIRIMIRRLAAT
jgi:putative transposase